MRIAFFSTKDYDKASFEAANKRLPEGERHELLFFEARLDEYTAALLREDGLDVVCAFVNDDLSAPVIDKLKEANVKLIAMRSAGTNNVDMDHIIQKQYTELSVVHVPAYSPNAVAEHSLAMLMTLNRRTHKVYNRVRDGNFSLEGITPGWDLKDRTVGVLGTGRIGEAFVRIMVGMGCRVLGYDARENPRLQKLQQRTRAVSAGDDDEGGAVGGSFKYATLEEIWPVADVISLHLPLTPQTQKIINAETLAKMKPNAVILNTSRGGLVDSKALIGALKAKRLGGVGLDTYEEEEELFYRDLSEEVVSDDTLIRLMTFPNVLITPHQGFFTQEALRAIADTTLTSVSAWAKGQQPKPTLVYNGQPVGCPPSSGGKNVKAGRAKMEEKEQEAKQAAATATTAAAAAAGVESK